MARDRVRFDGKETKRLIFETAGFLFAQYGYEKTTSKKICSMANVNLAAINYHFGCREELYKEVLIESHNHIMHLNFLQEIDDSDASLKEKVEKLVDFFAIKTLKSDEWHMKLFIREIINPSKFVFEIFDDKILPKTVLSSRIIGDYLGLEVSDKRLWGIIWSMVTPFVTLLIMHSTSLANLLTDQVEFTCFIDIVKKQVLSDLENTKKMIAAEKRAKKRAVKKDF